MVLCNGTGAMTTRHQTVRLSSHGIVTTATIRSISRFGAYLIDLPDLEIGAVVELSVPLASGREVLTAATVVNVITAATALRHGVEAGAIVQFRHTTSGDDSQFHAAIAEGASAPPVVHAEGDVRTSKISADELAELVEQTRPQVFAGSLGELDLPTVLMMLEQTRKSGRLSVSSSDTLASLDLVEGRLVHAVWSRGEARSLEIVMAVLDWSTGTFELSAALPGRGDVWPLGTVTELLIEHARRRDEERRGPATRS